jgi:hypothetical protein
MTAILPHPNQLLRLVDERPRAAAHLLKEQTKTPLDIKTLTKFLQGVGRMSKVRQLIDSLVKQFTFFVVLAKEFEKDGQEDDYVQAWRVCILGDKFTAKPSPSEHQSSDPILRYLLPLVRQSLDATAAALAGDFARANEIIRQSIVARFLPEKCCSELKAVDSIAQFETATTPVRLVGILALLAVLEKYHAPLFDESQLTYCVPVEDDGPGSKPFARCVSHLLEACGLKPGAEAAQVLMGADIDQDVDMKRLSRWVSGHAPPNQANFCGFYISAFRRTHKLRGINAPFDLKEARMGAEWLYFALKGMSSLATVPLFEDFGGKVGFFSRYQAVFDEIK